jgi:hypothetical protein
MTTIPEYLEGSFQITLDLIDHGLMNNRYFTPRMLYLHGKPFKMAGTDEVSPKDPQYASPIAEFEKLPKQTFRLKDDDGKVWFVGKMLDYRDTDNDGAWEFAPLDGFGEAYGCTSIEILEGQRWVPL